MFPTFISILDIQSWWEVPSIAHFCSLFRTAFNLLDFDIEDLEEALLTDGTEESSWLQELIVRLLSGCLPNNEISTFNYQMFLRRLFRQKCQEHDRYNPFNTDIDFQLLPLRTKVDILHALCDFRLDADDVLDQLKNLEADSLRVEPLGYDSNESAYWYFYGTRLYREDFKTKNNKKKSVWQVICFTEDDWFQLTKKFKKSTCKVERQLHNTLSENFLPELPRLFKEKESLARKRLLENQPRRTSSRLRKLEIESEKEVEEKKFPLQEEKAKLAEEEKQRKRDLERKRQEACDRRAKLKEQSEEDSLSEASESRYEMARGKSKKSKSRQRKSSSCSTSSKDNVTSSKASKRNKKHDKNTESVSKTSSSKLTTVGRQTNNSLSAATGQILIQPVPNTIKKKLKTSQVFRQTEEDLQTGMHKILDHVKNHEDAWPFTDPVEEEYAPNYYSIIRKPMDLQRMEERLDAGYYKSFTKFRTDFQLIVDNCRLYNGAENEYTDMVDNLLQVFEKATEKYLDQISSDDDEIAVEFLDKDPDKKQSNNSKEEAPATSKRKPMLAAQTDTKRDRSLSEDSLSSKRSHSYESLNKVSAKAVKPKKPEKTEKVTKKQAKSVKGKKDKSESKKIKSEEKREKQEYKKQKGDSKKEKAGDKISVKENKCSKLKKSAKKEKKKSPVRSRSSSRSPSRSPLRSNISSPPPSWPPSSPDCRFDFTPKENPKKRQSRDHSDSEDSLPKGKHRKHHKLNTTFDEKNSSHQDKAVKSDYTPPLSPKPKDKHNKLRETIEKLKAKSEIAKIKSCEYDFEVVDHPKENKERNRKQEKDDKSKTKSKEKPHHKPTKKDIDLDLDGNSTMDSIQSESKKSKKSSSKGINPVNKNPSTMDALSIATEQTLKDINKWLDDTPKFSEFSSASNSPSYTGLEEFDVITGKMDPIPGKKMEKPSSIKKEGGVKDFKRRPFRDPSKFFKRREVQRTIDRLQPGKSKGNLISNVQNTNKADEIFPLGPLSKIKDTKNSLIVKTDTNAPKLSLGSVLDSFGKHKFVDDQKKEEEKVAVQAPKEEVSQTLPCVNVMVKDTKDVTAEVAQVKEDKEKETPVLDDSLGGGATPNLSAWFKAFGAPKVQPSQKKNDVKLDSKENEKSEDIVNKPVDSRKVAIPTASPNPDSPLMPHGQPIPRQRKISTGSSVSERSSFSQDMDSPRVGMDERGAYPAPYPSPLHRSPSGASPIMASPRPDISPKAAAYPTINGQIRVGFYQDTVSNKSSPDKSCSPRENPQSPYGHYSEHVYTPNTTENSYYSYANSPYYTHAPNYSSTNPTPPYNMEVTNSSYYDTSKSLTDQYQAKTSQNYTANSPASNHSSPAHPQHSPGIHSQHSPNMIPQQSPGMHSQHSPSIHSPHSPQQSPSAYQQHSPNVLPQNSPNIHPQNSPSMHPQLSPNMQCQNSPSVMSQHSPSMHPQHSPSMQSQNSPSVHPQSTSMDAFQHQEDQSNIAEKFLQQQSSQNPMFPVKKRVYNENDNVQIDSQRFEIDSRLSQKEINRSLQMGQQVTLGTASPQESIGRQESKEASKSYIHQNIPDPKPLAVHTSVDTFNKTGSASPMPQQQQQQQLSQMQKDTANIRTMGYPASSASNPYGASFTGDSNYPLNIPNARPTTQHAKMDSTKYTNMGYTGPDANYNRSLQQFIRPELNYTRTTVQASMPQKQPPQQTQVTSSQNTTETNEMSVRYANQSTAGYKGVELNNPTNPQQAHSNFSTSMHQGTRSSETVTDRGAQMQEIPSGYKPDVVMSRSASYNVPSIDVDQPLGLGRNITNLSHIVDRFNNDEQSIIASLQTTSSYYSEKGLGTPHMFTKPISTSASALPMFSQANMAAMQSYNQSIQGTATTMYNRQMTELQNPGITPNEAKASLQPQPTQEKKVKKRKSSKNTTPALSAESQQPTSTNQGFQSYAGLKGNSSIEPSAISLKTSSVVPGSAFNFGPTPAGLSIGTGLYGDKDAYPNFLEEFRSAPNYYMAAAAAAHHRSTPETGEKPTRVAHQNSNPQATPSYPFLGAPQARPTYPIGGPFIPNAQAQLMDTSSPLYQHYLQAGVLNQGLLGPPGAYPPGYHPALSMRQPYDSMTRPSWL